jgi:hypothetical protein
LKIDNKKTLAKVSMFKPQLHKDCTGAGQARQKNGGGRTHEGFCLCLHFKRTFFRKRQF